MSSINEQKRNTLNNLEQRKIYTLEHMEPKLSFLGNSLVLKCGFDQFETNSALMFSPK